MVNSLIPLLSARVSLALLLIRGVVGAAFIEHGLPKIHHPASWMTMAMGPHAFAPPWLQAVVAVVEVVGGAALAAGFLTPLVAFALGIDMAVALFAVHLPMGAHWIGGPGAFEVPLFYLIAMIALLLSGPGKYSVDALMYR